MPFNLGKKAFNESFSKVALEFKMDWRVFYSDIKAKVAIFVSKEDHCLTDLLYRHKGKELECEIALVISNHPDAKSICEFYGIPFFEVNTDNKIEAEEKILRLLKEKEIDLIILARYMQILSADFIKEFKSPIINIHHSFLPAFEGAKPYHQAHQRGVKIIGATSHYVTADLDQGPIIEQDILRVSHRDGILDLVQKGRDMEKIVLSRAVKWHIENKVLIYSNKTVVFD